jgi:predicted methyltransferase
LLDACRGRDDCGRAAPRAGRRQAAAMDTKEFDEVFTEIVVNPVRDEGFRTADFPRSEIIANPNDTKDYLHGMWSLPAKAVTSTDYALPRPDRQQSLAYGCG